MGVPTEIRELTERFERNKDAYRSPQYNETQLRREFLDPFFKALGWDIDNEQGYAEAYKDVIHEDAIKVGEATKAPDYCFRIGGARKFFLEAKKPAVDIKHDVSPAFQLRRYAWTTKLPLSILSDFEEFAVYDCRVKPDQKDSAAVARILFIPYGEYAERRDEIASVFSRDAVLKGSFDKYAESNKAKRGTADVDDEFLKTIEGWRADLARNLALRNPKLTQRELNFAVQRIIDRIIFLRICEGRGIEDYGRLQALTNGDRIYPRLAQQFEQADDRYNSGLFHFKSEKDRHEAPDELTLGLDLDDKLLRDILKSLYYPECPYVFSALPADILGQVYEQFLGKVIRLTEGHRAVVEEKPEVKKAGGVYYTPTYIVEYIVQQTVGKLLDEATGSARAPRAAVGALADGSVSDAAEGLREGAQTDARGGRAPLDARSASRILSRVSKLRILDPACGSGSFLLGAYEFLLKWHLDFYVRLLTPEEPTPHPSSGHPRPSEGRGRGEGSAAHWLLRRRDLPIVETGKGWKLTIGERKRILLDNIYGVDIDAQAVETTKLSLLLKVLEGETQQSLQPVLRMFQERALPDLGDNIKCGNSLIGPDFYRQAELPLLTDDERYRINVFDWHKEFPQIFRRKSSTGELRETAAASPLDYTMPGVPLHGSYSHKKRKDEKAVSPAAPVESEWEGGFDAVIGNPPYGAFTGGAESVYFREKYRSPANSLDTFLLFVERGHQLLRNQGLLGMIIPSGWVSTPSAKPLRNLFIESFKPLSFVSLPFDVFRAYIDTVVVTAQRVPQPEREKSDAVQLFVFPSKFKISAVRNFAQFEKTANYRDWLGSRHKEFLITCSRAETKILEKVRQQPRTLGDFVLVKRGIEVFEPQPTKSGFVNPKPALTGVLQRYNLEHGEKGFVGYEAEVQASKPFEYFSAPRILLRQVLSRKLRLQGVFTTETFLTNQSVQSLIANPEVRSAPDLLFLLGIINGRLLSWYFVNFNSVARRDDFPKIIIQQTRELPFPDWNAKSDKAAHDRMVKFVEQMLELHKRLSVARTPQEKTSLERQITATDAQIDRLVYDLYGLTEDEIKIVEEAAK